MGRGDRQGGPFSSPCIPSPRSHPTPWPRSHLAGFPPVRRLVMLSSTGRPPAGLSGSWRARRLVGILLFSPVCLLGHLSHQHGPWVFILTGGYSPIPLYLLYRSKRSGLGHGELFRWLRGRLDLVPPPGLLVVTVAVHRFLAVQPRETPAPRTHSCAGSAASVRGPVVGSELWLLGVLLAAGCVNPRVHTHLGTSLYPTTCICTKLSVSAHWCLQLRHVCCGLFWPPPFECPALATRKLLWEVGGGGLSFSICKPRA